MKPYFTSNRINIFLVVLFILLGIGSFAYNQYLISRILQQEKSGVELWAKAIEYTSNPVQEEISQNLLEAANYLRRESFVPDSVIQLIEDAEADRTSQTFVTQEIVLSEDRFLVPRVIADKNGEIFFREDVDTNMDDQDLIEYYSSMNEPIEIRMVGDDYDITQYVYYGESPTVRYLRYFPYIQLSLLALLLGIGFVSYRTISRSEQSNLWVGMTKEAAHQLGTPLSSMYGWIELLREEKKGDEFTERICDELENDISRLRGVSERFNQIGSEPELEYHRLAPIIEDVVNYMKHRLPKHGKNVDVFCELESGIQAKVNPDLFQWALENLIKNAMDAIKSSATKAQVSVKMKRVENEVIIEIADTGVGIEKKYQNEIFKPGYSTKKRGWGLGLSLTKRIIEGYHKGKLVLYDTEVGKGTTMRIVLKVDLTELPDKKSSEPSTAKT